MTLRVDGKSAEWRRNKGGRRRYKEGEDWRGLMKEEIMGALKKMKGCKAAGMVLW